MNLKILHEDECLLVLIKPGLIHSVSHDRGSGVSVAAWLCAYHKDFTTAAEHIGDGGLINRLDFETSGVLVAAKNRQIWGALRAQFDKQQILKRYRALLEGRLMTASTVEGYIGNRYRGSKKVTFAPAFFNRSQPTRSQVTPLDTIAVEGERTLALIVTETGARHQVRAHCAYLGHPLAGDTLYGGTPLHSDPEIPSFILHAAEISLMHPASGRRVVYNAQDPLYLKGFLK